MYPLTVIVYAALAVAAIAVVAAVLTPRHRALLLMVAALGFAVAGVLGILSIGLLFLVAAAICAAVAARARGLSRV